MAGKFFDLMADTLVGPTARQHHPEIRATARAMMNAVTLDAMLAVQQGLMSRPDSVPTLETIHVPVCAIAGGEDQSSTPEEMRVIAKQLPNAEFTYCRLPDTTRLWSSRIEWLSSSANFSTGGILNPPRNPAQVQPIETKSAGQKLGNSCSPLPVRRPTIARPIV